MILFPFCTGCPKWAETMLCWLGLGFQVFHCHVCPILLGLMGIWQKRLGNWARWWNTEIKVNPTQASAHLGHPVLNAPMPTWYCMKGSPSCGGLRGPPTWTCSKLPPSSYWSSSKGLNRTASLKLSNQFNQRQSLREVFIEEHSFSNLCNTNMTIQETDDIILV